MRDGATLRVPLRASRPWRAERCDPFRSVRLWGFVRRQRAPKSVPLPTATVAAGDNPCGVRRARVPGGQGGKSGARQGCDSGAGSWTRLGSITAKHLVDSRAVADHANQRLLVRAPLLQAELDRLDGIRSSDGEMRLLVGLDQGRQYLQSISSRGSLGCSPKALDFAERRRVAKKDKR